MAITIANARYYAERMSVIFDATCSGQTYRCAIPEDDLDLKIGDEALAEFERRISEIEPIIEAALRVAKIEIDNGSRQLADMVKIRI